MIPNPPPNVNIEVTRNFHAHVSPTKPTEDIELNSFRIDRVTLRIPRKACTSLTKASTKGSQLLQDLPRLSDESKTVVSKIPITVENPNIQQIVTPLDIPASQFVHLLDNPSEANKTILGAEQLCKRDDWMGNMLQRIQVKAPKVSPRKKKKSPRRKRLKQKQNVAMDVNRRLEQENVQLKSILAATQSNTPTQRTHQSTNTDSSVTATKVTVCDAHTQTDLPPLPIQQQPNILVVEKVPDGEELGLTDRIVRKERIEARRQVRTLLNEKEHLGESLVVEDVKECWSSPSPTPPPSPALSENSTLSTDTCSSASTRTRTPPPPEAPPPIAPPPIPPPPIPPPPIPPPPIPPPPLTPLPSIAPM